MIINWPLIIYTIIGALFVVLIPLFVKWVFQAQEERLNKAKAIYDANREKIQGLVLAAQQMFPADACKEKYEYVLNNFDNAFKLPAGSIETLVNQAIALFKGSFAEQWKQLGGSTTTTTSAVDTVLVPPCTPSTTELPTA